MNLVLIVPGSQRVLGARARRDAGAEASAAVFAKAPAAVDGGLDAATLAALGLAADTPLAPLRALGAGVARGDDYGSPPTRWRSSRVATT